ncbi:hypothetical protein E4U22_002745 [Claviceps purpurea]|nr:hypothetical protein E4U44_007427 [Claviceps purpurea]KAG6311300.1 hypothetical protein E4U22_002745 [Claviceps purpurea]
MRFSLVFFGLAALALADVNQNANEMRDVPDIKGTKVGSDSPSKVLARAAACCSYFGDDPNRCWCRVGESCCGH